MRGQRDDVKVADVFGRAADHPTPASTGQVGVEVDIGRLLFAVSRNEPENGNLLRTDNTVQSVSTAPGPHITLTNDDPGATYHTDK